jgi:hypothetical protein
MGTATVMPLKTKLIRAVLKPAEQGIVATLEPEIWVAPTNAHIEETRLAGSCVNVVPESRRTVWGLFPVNISRDPVVVVPVMSRIGMVKS